MKTLTDNQKSFVLKFFKDDRYAGWMSIATQLIDNGECIVAGKTCIWHGGIGNFITTKTAENLVDCLLYKFDLEQFLTSAWFKEVIESEVEDVAELKREVELKVERLNIKLIDLYNLQNKQKQ